MRTPKFTALYSALLAAVVSLTAGPSWAVTLTSCSQTCSSNCQMTSDLSCNGQSGVILSSGADLDMNGHTLSCTASCPANAVTMTGSNNVVENNNPATEAKITGNFTKFVDCAGRSNSEVTGIRIESTVTGTPIVYGLNECAFASQNVLIDTIPSNGSWGIYTSGVANSDETTDNYLEGWAQAISVGGTRPIEVKRNQIVVHDAFSNEVGILIRNGTSGVLEVQNNSFYDDMTTYMDLILNVGGSSYVITGNYCDPSSMNCQICSICTHPTAPFL